MLVTTARRKYRDEWVALRVRSTDRVDVPVEGEVVLHAHDRSTFEEHEQAYRAAHPLERLYVFFAGDPIPEGLGVCLGKW